MGDLALYEGRLSDAARIFEEGAEADVEHGESYRAAAKLGSLAHVHLLREEADAAKETAEAALAQSEAVKIQLLAARVFVDTGDVARAEELAQGLASEFQAEPQAYAKIIEGIIALNAGEPREAVSLFTEANDVLDTWIGHFLLGRAYLEAGAFIQADSEFERCLTRRGEAVSLFLDEEPTYGFLPAVYFYQGRVREGLNRDTAADSYQTFLDIRGPADEDPLVAEARLGLDRWQEAAP